MELQNKINDLKAILAGAKRVEHVFNVELDAQKANRLTKQVYNRIVSFNSKYPKDVIKDPDMIEKNDPYGIGLEKSVGGYTSSRIFGNNADDLANLGRGYNINSNYLEDTERLVQPKLAHCEFRLKQSTCTEADIAKANQYLKQHRVSISAPLTTTPIADIQSSARLISAIQNVSKAKGIVIAKKNVIKLNAHWQKFLEPRKDDVRLEKDDLKYALDEYQQRLAEYNYQANRINGLISKAHEYSSASVLVEYRAEPDISNSTLLDLRPAEVSDLQKHTVKGSSFSKLYQNAVKTLNNLDFNDVNGSLNRITQAVSPIISNGIDNHDYYDLGVKASLVKNAVERDIPYQHSRTIKPDYVSDQDFAESKQRFIKQDKRILAQIPDNAKYLDDHLMPYSAKHLKDTVKHLKTNLTLTLFDENKDNDNFDPKITVDQARLVIGKVFEFAVYAKQKRYQKRANDLIKWVADNHPDAKISYRQLNPVGHYLYKRNIKNIKKSLA